ncbi:hypothetical protein [Roseomonas sp. 18066]|uniref:hypothetical protein n=1 Tax=Roseomonas sp. 18066 TaxID=2681412 RepID=UPI001358B0B3|nr:hypothetical protein [Roseomonas sp. 18066]
MPSYPVDPAIQAEARRLASEDLDRNLGAVAEMLAERGHHGPDGRPYAARTVANLLDEELVRRREDRQRALRAEAGADFSRWLAQHGQEFVAGGTDASLQKAASPER